MCLIGDIHHFSWKPLGENIIQLLGLVGLFHHHLASAGSHTIYSDLSPPCFPQLRFKRGDPDLQGRPLLGFRAAVAGWQHPGPCSQLPLTLHHGLLLPVSNRRVPVRVASGESCSKLSCDATSHRTGKCFPSRSMCK